MKETELKPCPFCDGEAEIHSICSWRETGGDEMFFVRCGGCLTRTRYFGTKKSAILMWNNRKPMREIVEYLQEQCERENKRFKDTVGTEMGERHFGWLSGLDEAIHKVKEVGGLDERS